MKPTTLAEAVAAGATLILRGRNRVYAPGDVAFRIAEKRSKFDPPGLFAYFAPVSWHGDGWRAAPGWRGPYTAIGSNEIVTVIE